MPTATSSLREWVCSDVSRDIVLMHMMASVVSRSSLIRKEGENEDSMTIMVIHLLVNDGPCGPVQELDRAAVNLRGERRV